MWNFKAEASWESMVSRADVLDNKQQEIHLKHDLNHTLLFVASQGFLWCKVPKAASESWTSIFMNKW